MEKLLRPKQVQNILGVGETTFYRLLKRPDFPRKVRISRQATAIKESELMEWIDAQQESELESAQ